MLHRVKRIRDLFMPGVFAVLVLITLVCVLASCATSSGGGAAGGGNPSATNAAHTDDGMSTVAVAQLPDEARDTMALIKDGGPYPYHQDGSVFQNRERLLPREPSGYYHEFTVETPGSSDRGARRIIKARDGTLYYTDDHYESFERIAQ